jgi:tRNA(fMet)-specific endonuclease VapC
MALVLDTDHLSLLERQSGGAAHQLAARLSARASDGVVTTIVNFEEQMRGWLSYLAAARTITRQIEAYRRLSRHLHRYCQITVLDFDEASATEYQRLRRLHPRIGTMDLKIAAIVLARNDTLLSRNLFRLRQDRTIEGGGLDVVAFGIRCSAPRILRWARPTIGSGCYEAS